jgi:ADP-ribose pyrophosphatase
VIHIYAARGLRHVGANLDVGEHLETFEARLDDAIEWVRDGIVTDTKTTLGLLWAERFDVFGNSFSGSP